jgi:hypothetical protein
MNTRWLHNCLTFRFPDGWVTVQKTLSLFEELPDRRDEWLASGDEMLEGWLTGWRNERMSGKLRDHLEDEGLRVLTDVWSSGGRRTESLDRCVIVWSCEWTAGRFKRLCTAEWKFRGVSGWLEDWETVWTAEIYLEWWLMIGWRTERLVGEMWDCPES